MDNITDAENYGFFLDLNSAHPVIIATALKGNVPVMPTSLTVDVLVELKVYPPSETKKTAL